MEHLNIKNKSIAIMFLLVWIYMGSGQNIIAQSQRAESFPKYTSTEIIWPGCFGILGAIQDQEILQNLKENNITPSQSIALEAGWYTVSGITADGERWNKKSVYFSKVDFSQGFGCAIKKALGKPCPDDAGICIYTREILQELERDLKPDCLNEAPVIVFRDSILKITWCDTTFTVDIPQEIYSFTRIEICEGDQYEWFGDTLSTAGTYQHHAQESDSVYILNLDIIRPEKVFQIKTIKEGDTLIINNQNITTPGRYLDTLVSEEVCDTILITEVILERETPNPCDQKDSLWQKNQGIGLSIFLLSNTREEYAGQIQESIHTIQYGLAVHYEWRLPNNSFLLNKKDCLGESFQISGGVQTTAGRFIQDVCACNNNPINDFWTTAIGGEYRAHWYGLWPFNLSLGVGGTAFYNKTQTETLDIDDLEEVKNWWGEMSLSPRIDYTRKEEILGITYGIFLTTPIRIIHNRQRSIDIQGGVRIIF